MSEISTDRSDLLELDIDIRMHDLWADTEGIFTDTEIEKLGPFMRAAYGRGYCDALKEVNAGDAAKLCLDNDYPMPT